MEERNEKNYEIKTNKKLEFITANTAFYRFLGSRLYATMDLIMPEDSRDNSIAKIFELRKGESFIMPLLAEDGTICDMITTIKDDSAEDIRVLNFIEIDDLCDLNLKLRGSVREYKALLSGFGSLLYNYVAADDKITFYRFDPEYRPVSEINVSGYNEICEKLDENKSSMIKAFVTALRSGNRQFQMAGCKELALSAVEDEELWVAGVGMYVDGVHVKTVGSISSKVGVIAQKTFGYDQLTGLILKEDIEEYAQKRVDEEKKPTTLAIIDIDNFKDVNDNYGHMKGDEVLRKCSNLIEREIDGYGKAGRIGGDEFLILIEHDDAADSENDESVRTILRSIKNDIFALYSDETDGFHVSASIGSSTYPSDVADSKELFMVSDFLMYRAKNKGKNRYIKYNPEKHGPVADIVKEKRGTLSPGISDRRVITKTEFLCRLVDMVDTGNLLSISDVIDDIRDHFKLDRILLYSLDDRKVVHKSGDVFPHVDLFEANMDILYDEDFREFEVDNVEVINNIKRFEHKEHIYNALKSLGIISFMYHRFKGKDGKEYLVSYESIRDINVWNTEEFYLYRLADRIYGYLL